MQAFAANFGLPFKAGKVVLIKIEKALFRPKNQEVL